MFVLNGLNYFQKYISYNIMCPIFLKIVLSADSRFYHSLNVKFLKVLFFVQNKCLSMRSGHVIEYSVKVLPFKKIRLAEITFFF